MQNKNIMRTIIKRAKNELGVYFLVREEETKLTEKIHLQITRFIKGSDILRFKFEKPINISKDEVLRCLNEIFKDVSTKKEFESHLFLDLKRNIFQTWMYEGEEDEIAVIEYLLNLKYLDKNWNIINPEK